MKNYKLSEVIKKATDEMHCLTSQVRKYKKSLLILAESEYPFWEAVFVPTDSYGMAGFISIADAEYLEEDICRHIEKYNAEDSIEDKEHYKELYLFNAILLKNL